MARSWCRARRSRESVKSKDRYKFQRVYPTGPQYAQLTGYFSRDFGLGGIESNQDSILSGSDSALFVNRVIDLFGNDEPKGGNVTVTINPKAQKAAFDGLRKLGTNVKGAVVAIEPATGKILAMVSSPTYDPNKLATHDFAAAGRTKARLQTSPDEPLQNRAIEETLPPGSTFKVVTASAALDKSRFTPRLEGARRARSSTCPRRQADPQRERRLLRRRPDHARPGARGLLQRGVRLARAQGRRRRTCGHSPRSTASATGTSPTSTTP